MHSSLTTTKKVQFSAIFLSWLFKAIIFTGMSLFATFTCAGNEATPWLSHCPYHTLQDKFCFRVDELPWGSALHAARSSFQAEHRVKSPSLQGNRNGETEQTSISTYAEELCKPGEEIGVEKYLAFPRAKLGILQETISE